MSRTQSASVPLMADADSRAESALLARRAILESVRDLVRSGRYSVAFYASQACDGVPIFHPGKLCLGQRYFTRPICLHDDGDGSDGGQRGGGGNEGHEGRQARGREGARSAELRVVRVAPGSLHISEPREGESLTIEFDAARQTAPPGPGGSEGARGAGGGSSSGGGGSPGQRFRVIAPHGVRVRAGCALDSPAKGRLPPGAKLRSLETRETAQGATRVRYALLGSGAGDAGGWVSVQSESGHTLLEPVLTATDLLLSINTPEPPSLPPPSSTPSLQGAARPFARVRAVASPFFRKLGGAATGSREAAGGAAAEDAPPAALSATASSVLSPRRMASQLAASRVAEEALAEKARLERALSELQAV
jgi:hypothetical protein